MKLIKKVYGALLDGPGPASLKEAIVLSLKGVSMGAADIIPGVSGGTLAFITGIYSSLVSAIAAVDGNFFKLLFTFQWIKALSYLHTRFLVPLFLGILITIISLARPMHFLLSNYKTFTWSFFFGLILYSILIVGREISDFKKVSTLLSLVSGVLFAFFLVGAIPVETPENYLFIFFSGAIGAIAMILPGISGAFILLLLGKYHYITGILKSPFVSDHPVILIVFCFGIATGLVSFSKALKYLFSHYPQTIYSVLTGFMIGAMRKIWPWKEVIQEKIVDGKTFIIEEANVLPTEFNSDVIICLLLVLAGAVIVYSIDKIAQKKSN